MMTRLPLSYVTSDTDTLPHPLIFISFFLKLKKKQKQTNKDNQSNVPFPVDTAIVSRFQGSF